MAAANSTCKEKGKAHMVRDSGHQLEQKALCTLSLLTLRTYHDDGCIAICINGQSLLPSPAANGETLTYT